MMVISLSGFGDRVACGYLTTWLGVTQIRALSEKGKLTKYLLMRKICLPFNHVIE